VTRVLRHLDGLNLYKSCVLCLSYHLVPDHPYLYHTNIPSWVYPSVDYWRYLVDIDTMTRKSLRRIMMEESPLYVVFKNLHVVMAIDLKAVYLGTGICFFRKEIRHRSYPKQCFHIVSILLE
jgi:hypothetical protein